jgi:hypothetical protein
MPVNGPIDDSSTEAFILSELIMNYITCQRVQSVRSENVVALVVTIIVV